MTKTPIVELPSLLSFRRRCELSDGHMNAVFADGSKKPITAYFHSQRMPFSTESHKDDVDSDGVSEKTGNLASGFKAKMPADATHLEISFVGAYFPIVEGREVCSSKDWFKSLSSTTMKELAASPATRFVAQCLAYNIASGSWGWRNRDNATDVTVSVEVRVGGVNTKHVFSNVRNWPKFAVATPSEAANGQPDPKDTHAAAIAPLADAIYGALAGLSGPVRFIATGRFELFGGQEVWPSQLRLDGVKDKNYFSFGGSVDAKTPVVGMTAEKLGNSIRTYDRFHGSSDFDLVIPIESLGGSLQVMKNLRAKEDRIMALMPKAATDVSSLPIEQAVYVVGWLIRGGVLNKENVEKKEAKEAAKEAAKAAKETAKATKKAAKTAS